MDGRYLLVEGTQIRQEDFRLLFYTQKGPRLYFLPSGNIIDKSFFQGDQSLEEWLTRKKWEKSVSGRKLDSLKSALENLRDKGVIHEC